MTGIAVIDDEATARKMTARILSKAGYRVETFDSGLPFLRKMEQKPFDVVFLDLKLPDMGGMEILSHIKLIHQWTQVIIVTGYGSIGNAVEATKEGAFHYLTKPCRGHDICLMAERAMEKIKLHQENDRLRSQVTEKNLLPGFIGNSKSMQTIFATISKVAQINCNVLLEAETGTGKQLTARAIHDLGPRSNAPFIYFNCGGFTEELICSELFGHERGAFTGADCCKAGLLESASGGTVLLDEVGEMPMSMQVKLLHVLQERQIMRVGGTRPIDLHIRIIAATNRDLKQEVQNGTFREDLYYRLNVVTIRLPRLVKRKDDIPLLIQHFITKVNKAYSVQIKGVTPRALELLMLYDYPGNVRELENIIQHAAALTDEEKLTPEDLPSHLHKLHFQDSSMGELLSMDELEKRHISNVLSKTQFNLKSAGEILKISRTTMWRKLKKYGISVKGNTEEK
ncbi:MAG: sigma-54-dependent Fis family transcriptional regulator [Desulfocapsa sp.]|nr:MAG: sigma-54-dependent Fis family transcriptional regulator [Desulfocapsa sp.]